MGVFGKDEPRMDPMADYRARWEDVEYVVRGLHGQSSRDVFLDLLAYHCTHGHKYLLRHKPGTDRYFRHRRRYMSGEVRIVDCGAYTGDTVKAAAAFAAGSVRYMLVDAFEPDPANFKRLEAAAAKLRSDKMEIRPVMACAYDQTGPVGFRAGLGPKSHVDEESDDRAQCVRLSDAIRTGLPVDLLKISACGAELGVAAGARDMIMADRPYLAVALPGSGFGALDLCTYLLSVHPGYEWTVRSYSRVRPDAVLYGMPEAW